LQLNKIESLVDCYASPLQLRNWPYLSHLWVLIVKGVRDFVDVFNFAYQHAKILMHLTIESSEYFNTVSGIWNIHISEEIRYIKESM
jgi:hypothetical protein